MPKFNYLKSSQLAIFTSLAISASTSALYAQEAKVAPEKAAKEVAPDPLSQLKKVNETTYQLGEVTIDQKKRAISFGAEVEITSEIVEYAVVTPAGKIHEALFITNARPLHLNIAFKLLGYKENKSLFLLFVDNIPTDKNMPATEEEKTKSYFTTMISWTDEKTKKVHSHNINDLIQNTRTKETPAKFNAKWSYGGSYLNNGQFVAEMNNDLIAIFTDKGAVANYAGKGREDDTLWYPVAEKLPEKGTKVTITITPDFPADKKK